VRLLCGRTGKGRHLDHPHRVGRSPGPCPPHVNAWFGRDDGPISSAVGPILPRIAPTCEARKAPTEPREPRSHERDHPVVLMSGDQSPHRQRPPRNATESRKFFPRTIRKPDLSPRRGGRTAPLPYPISARSSLRTRGIVVGEMFRQCSANTTAPARLKEAHTQQAGTSPGLRPPSPRRGSQLEVFQAWNAVSLIEKRG
jgi:hypothetical protein